MQDNVKVVVMAAPGPSTDILVNWLKDAGFPPAAILLEQAQSRRSLLRGRWRRLGARAVLGQLAFMALVSPLLRRKGVSRRGEILREYGLRDDPLPEVWFTRIASANAPETVDLMRDLGPDVVVLNGTRILKPAILAATPAPVLNIHAGITPAYRGVHGGYWALWQGRPEDFGATLHLVDRGVDTGGILAHCRVDPAPADNFTTYPLLQLAVALPALSACLGQIRDRQELCVLPAPPGPSRQWYHPTLWEYLAGWWRRGVR